MSTHRTNSEQTMTSALAKRKLDSFAMFSDKKFVSGYQNLITIQPLNKSKKRGWHISESRHLFIFERQTPETWTHSKELTYDAPSMYIEMRLR